MKTSQAADFDIMTSNEAGFESVVLTGPLWSCPMMATRAEAIILAKVISLCCFQPTQFTTLLASGDRISISRRGNWVVLQFGQVTTFLVPVEGHELSETILEAWCPAPAKVSRVA